MPPAAPPPVPHTVQESQSLPDGCDNVIRSEYNAHLPPVQPVLMSHALVPCFAIFSASMLAYLYGCLHARVYGFRV